MNEIISIICPVYNCEKYITQCVESVINQTNGNWELILIDDGSTDNSKYLCDNFSRLEKRITTIHKKNEGQMNARIDGIKKASGKYIMFLDSDDFLDKNAIETLEKKLLSNNDVDALIFNADVFPTKPLSKKIPKIMEESTLKGKNDIFQFVFGSKMFGYLWMYCFKKEILINALKLDNAMKDVRYTEDGAFVYNVLSCCSLILTIKNNLYFYRDNPDSITHNLTTKDRRDRFLVYDFIYSNIYHTCESFCFDNELCVYISWILFSYLEHQKNKNDFKKAFKECKHSFIFKYACKRAKTKNKKFKLYRLLLKFQMPSVFYKIKANNNE